MLQKRESLSSQLKRMLARDIETQIYTLGERIPTEAELCRRYQVSRTVVREAIASLRADGLLISRQGIGVFVGKQARLRPFEIDVETRMDAMHVYDFRISIEVEAAGLAAERHTHLCS